MKFNIKAAITFSGCLLLSAGLFAQVKHKPVARTGLKASIASGEIVYKRICLSCHMADGGGVQNMNPTLSKTTYVLGNKTKLITIVLNGFKEKVEINDETYSNVMAPHKDLKDKEIADVLTYVRHSFGNKASAVTVAEVRKVRAADKVKK